MKDFIINLLITIIKFALIVGMVYLMYYIEGSSPTKESFAISIGGVALFLTLLNETKQERGKF
jgi:hypothetical protein